MIPVPSRRPNPSSICDSKGAPTYSKLSHPDAQRRWSNESMMVVVMISSQEIMFFSGLFAVWACCWMSVQEALTPKSICRGSLLQNSLHATLLLKLDLTLCLHVFIKV